MRTNDIVIVGLNHLRAPVGCRERAAVPKEARAGEARKLKDRLGLRETVLLSTCSRMEVYAAADDTAAAEEGIRDWFAERAGAGIAGSLYAAHGPNAVRHLTRVAAGLDSWILGESEILGQVKEAHAHAMSKRLTGSLLNRVFNRAVAAGKAVRTRTGLQDGIRSIGGAAAMVARRIFGDAEECEVVLFGAGQAAEATARHLAAKNFHRVVVANRTLKKAQVLARPLGAEAVPLDEGLARLARAEAAVFSVSGRLLRAEELRRRIEGRLRPLFLIDLGLPRNVEPACAELDGVYLYDLDDLKRMLEQSMSRKAGAREEAEAIAGEAAAACCALVEKAADRILEQAEVLATASAEEAR